MKSRKKDQELPIKELAILSRESADPKTRRVEDTRTEERVPESQEKYRLIVEKSNEGICVVQDGRFQFINVAMANLLGYAEEELNSRPLASFIHPDDREMVLGNHSKRIREAVSPVYPFRIMDKNGDTRWVEIRSCGIDWNGGPATLNFITEITERKQGEEARRKSEEEAKRLAKEAAVLAEIGKIISSTLDIEEVYESFAKEAQKLITSDRISINLINLEEGKAVVSYVAGLDIPGRRFCDTYLLKDSVSEKIRGDQLSLLIQPETQEELEDEFPKFIPHFQAGLRSMMGVPLIYGDAVIGVLYLYSRKLKAYTDRDLRLAEGIGAQIAGAIANAQFFLERKRAEEALQRSEEEARRLAQENASVAEIGRIISSTLNIEEVYERFAAEARKLIPFDRIAVSLNNPGEGTATITYVSGVEFEGKRIGDVFPLARSGSEEVNRTRRGFLVQPEALEELEGRFSGLIPTFQAGLRSMIVVPLISRNQVIGVLHLRSKESKAYTDRDLRLAERIANQIAGAIANAQFFLERKRAEEALRKSEERFRDLYDSAPVGYHEYDTEGRITNVNRTDLEMLGYSQEEMIGQYIWKFNVGEDIVRQQVLEKLKGLRPPGRSLERTYRRKDGTTFPVFIEDRLNKDELGRITGIRCTIQDITEPKGMEAALRESEAEAKRLAAETEVLAKIGRLISSTLNTDEVYELLAEEVRNVLPFDRMSVNIIDRERNTATSAYVTGVPVRERAAKESYPLAGSLTAEGIRTREGIIFHPQNEDAVAGRFPSLLPTFRFGLRSMMMVPLISKDRTIGILHFMAMQPHAYTQDDLRLGLRVGNQIAGAMANSLLFTEFQKADSALRESEEKYRLLVQNANDAIFIIQDGAIRFSNVRTEALFGYSPGELAAIPFVNHIHPGKRERILGPGSQVSAVETFSKPQSFRIINKSNQEVWVQLKSIGVEWEGKPATLNFASDITEQKKLEAQFLQAQKMEAIGTLAGGIAHDFNNILSGLLGYAELISLETRPGSSIHRNLEELLKVGVRAKDLVKQILTLSRRTLQEKKPIRVEPLVKEAVKLLRSSLPTTIEIRLDIKEDPGIIEADPTQVHQVLLNLCTNSFHAMEETGGLLTIGLSPINLDPYAAGQHADLQQGPYVRLTVSDTGMGMAREISDRIFDPYFTTKEAGKGTGLGLAVVHGIVRSHGGAIKVYSEPGKGTTFHIYFPRVEISAEGPSLGLTEESLPRGKGEHIFLIDDEPVLLEIGKQMLEHLGYQVTVRTSSIETLGLFSSQPGRFHLVITDMTMPNMTGEKLAREILRIRPGLPIILCTGFSEHVTEEKAKALGIREFLMKPLTLKDLARAVRRNLPPSVD